MKDYKQYNDHELLHLLAEGNEKAFTEIYHRYWKMVYALGYSRLKDRPLTEDLLHDVFAGLWKNRDKTEIYSLQHYLASACRYMVFALIRKHTKERNYRAGGEEISSATIAEDELLYKQLHGYISKEIESLPERCRLIFKYSREKGMSNKEIATEMKISQKTVENQINKALHHLRFSMKRILLLFL